jgi:hypothetical protein
MVSLGKRPQSLSDTIDSQDVPSVPKPCLTIKIRPSVAHIASLQARNDVLHVSHIVYRVQTLSIRTYKMNIAGFMGQNLEKWSNAASVAAINGYLSHFSGLLLLWLILSVIVSF